MKLKRTEKPVFGRSPGEFLRHLAPDVGASSVNPLNKVAGRGERGFAVEKDNSGRDLCWSICCSCNILTFLDLS